MSERPLPQLLRTTTAPLGAVGTRSGSKATIDAGGISVRHCPVTCGVATRMTEAAFVACCEHHRAQVDLRRRFNYGAENAVEREHKKNSWCAVCKGQQRPAELTIISREEVEAMAKQTKIGVCENCGDKGALVTNNGQRVCSTCARVRSAVNSHLERVALAARHLGKGEELLAALVPAGGLAVKVTADLLQEISGIVGYAGEDPGELVAAVRRQLNERGPDCAECDAASALLEIADLVDKKGASSGLVVGAVRELLNDPWPPSGGDQHRVDLLRACGLELDYAVSASSRKDWSWAAAAGVQTIAELERDLQTAVASYQAQEREVEGLRERIQDVRTRNIWYREALQVLRVRLGLSELGEEEDVVERMLEAIGTLTQSIGRSQELARTADLRADQAEAELGQAHSEINGFKDEITRYKGNETDYRRRIQELNDRIAEVDAVLDGQDLAAWEPEPTVPVSTWGGEDLSLLADFGRKVLRGEVAIEFRGARS